MKIKYTTHIKSCPNCGVTYSRKTFRYGENAEEYGSPILCCKKCGHTFVDRQRREIAVSGYKKHDLWPITDYSLGVIGSFLVIGIFMFIANDNDYGKMSVSVCGITVAYNLIRYPIHMLILRKKKKASEERLSNMQYAIALADLEYDVPAKYLPEGYKPIKKSENAIIHNRLFEIEKTRTSLDGERVFILRVFGYGKSYEYKFTEAFKNRCTVEEFINNCKNKNIPEAEIYLENLKHNNEFIEYIEDKPNKSTDDIIVEKINDRQPNANEHKCSKCGNIQSKSISRCLRCSNLITEIADNN